MKLLIKNIGKLEDAIIEIKGITVIGGENNTGKSTIAKSLFSIFDGFYCIEQKILEERLFSISHLLQSINRGAFMGRMNSEEMAAFSREIIQKSDYYKKDIELLKADITLKFQLDSEPKGLVVYESVDLDNLVKQIENVLNIPDKMIFDSVVEKKLNAEFDGQLLNIYSNLEGSISLEIKTENFKVFISENGISTNGIESSIYKEIVYIADPFVLDDANNINFLKRYGNHRLQLLKKILYLEENESVIDKLIMEKGFEKIYEKLGSVCKGSIYRRKNGRFAYQVKNAEKILNIDNVSTGLKTFIILKTLLMNGLLESNGTIILDEPEIHLHPEWQLLFAEIIVLLQKEFGMNILLNTHSPYFLRAIQVYSAKYGIHDMCRYYMSELSDTGSARIVNVTDNIDKLYEKLSRPLQKLEDEEWNID